MSNIWNSITSFVDKYLIVGLAIIIALIAAFAGWQTYKLSDAKADLKTAQTENLSLKGEVATGKLALELKDGVVKTLEARNAELLTEQDQFNSETKDINDATADEDGDPADVLCIAVSGTRCLRNNSGN